jgi:hypothetical protein
MLSPSAFRFIMTARISFSLNEGIFSVRMTRPCFRAQHVRVTQTRTFSIPGEASLAPDARAVLQQVGAALDEHRRLRVHTHGRVALDEKSLTATLAKENGNEGQREKGPAARSRKRPAPRKGPSGGSRPPRGARPSRGSRPAGAASRVGGDVLRAAYEGQVTRLAEAYPTLQTFPDDDGMWLLARSAIISGLAREATFLVALPYRSDVGPRAWGFWTADGRHWWIGPRHTNFQDGSICAFSPADGAWSDGDDLRTLLDLYSVWAFRHLHLEFFGRWAGKQYTVYGAHPLVQAYYRRIECQDDELCGCGSETRRYADCCKPYDHQLDIIKLMPIFLRHVPGGFTSRQPPASITGFVEGQSSLPRIADVHLQIVATRQRGKS